MWLRYKKPVLWFLCIVFILLNVYRAVSKSWSFADPTDFRGVYVGANLIADDVDIYDNRLGANLWNQRKQTEEFSSNTDFGDRNVSIAIYPPQTFICFYYFKYLSWSFSRIVWWVVCILSLTIIIWLVYQWSRNIWLSVAVLAFSGTFFALSLGQPLLPVLALLGLAIYLYKDNKTLAGICIGLAMIKFSAVIPFVFWFLAKKEIKVLVVAGLTTVLTFIPVFIINPEIIAFWIDQTSWYYNFIYTPGPENDYTFNNSELTILLDYYFPASISLWKTFNSIGQLVGYLFIGFLLFKNRIKELPALVGLLLVSFLFSYHLSYDPLLFFIPLAMLKQGKFWSIIIAYLALLSLPINAVFGDITLLKFNYPILTALALIAFTFVSIYKLEDEHTHPSIT